MHKASIVCCCASCPRFEVQPVEHGVSLVAVVPGDAAAGVPNPEVMSALLTPEVAHWLGTVLIVAARRRSN